MVSSADGAGWRGRMPECGDTACGGAAAVTPAALGKLGKRSGTSGASCISDRPGLVAPS